MSSIVNIESFISIVTVLILVAGICVYIHKRAGSSFSLINKIVNFLYSGKEFHSKEIREIWYEREDVERFNTVFSTRAENKMQIEGFYTWVNKLQLNFKMLTNLSGNLDMKRKKITKTCWAEISFFGLLTPLAGLFSLFIFLVSVNDHALIKRDDYKDVGWFWINSNVAYSFQAPFESDTAQWKVYKSACNKGVKNESIPESFNNMLCESFDNEESMAFINNMIDSQKTLKYHSLFVMLLAIYMYSLTNESLRTKKARKMVYERTIAYMRDKKIR